MTLFFRRAALAVALASLGATALPGCTRDTDKKPPVEGALVLSGANVRSSPAARVASRHRIDSLEAKIHDAVQSPTKAPDIRLTMYTIQAYQYFAADFPRDPRAPEALDRAGQLWSGVLGDHQKAVERYEKVYQEYPQYKNRPQLLIQQGVASEAAHDTAGAATAYRRILTGYPQHPLAKQARGLLKLLRMSAAERAKMFDK
ncbi:MAG: tetratricopeptide repeat protein [Hymenobacteraceae bacterium]|nr:tetratricopeptide repeat protein [Hymenobacteraceae bacterium]